MALERPEKMRQVRNVKYRIANDRQRLWDWIYWVFRHRRHQDSKVLFLAIELIDPKYKEDFVLSDTGKTLMFARHRGPIYEYFDEGTRRERRPEYIAIDVGYPNPERK